MKMRGMVRASDLSHVDLELLALPFHQTVSVVEGHNPNLGAFRQAVGQGIAAMDGSDFDGVTDAMRDYANHGAIVSKTVGHWQGNRLDSKM